MEEKILLPYQNLILKWMINFIQNPLFIKDNRNYDNIINDFDHDEDRLSIEKYIEENHNESFKSGLLALDMGLGKTFITVKYIQTMNFNNNIIIIPPNILQQWINELKCNNLTFTVFDNKDTNMECLKFNKYGHQNIIVSYYKLTNFVEGVKKFITDNNTFKFDAIIADEAHMLANNKTSFHKNVNQIKDHTKVIWCLTGTPIINSHKDIVNIKSIIDKAHSIDTFFYNNYISIFKDDTFIQNQINIPNKHISNIFIQMDPWHTKQYLKLLTGVRSIFYNNSRLQVPLIVLMMKLRQCAVHPAIMLSNNNTIADSSDIHNINPYIINSELDQFDNDDIINNMGNKYSQMINIIQNTPDDDKIIIFTNWNNENKQIKLILNEYEISNHIYNKFSDIKFVQDNNIKVIICNIRKCAIGLNMQFANHIIFMEPYWNYAIIKQAIDRVHRIGQNKEVFIYNLITLGTIEVYINNLINHKINIHNQFNQYGEIYNSDKKILKELLHKIIMSNNINNNIISPSQFIMQFNEINNHIEYIHFNNNINNNNNNIPFQQYQCFICNQQCANNQNIIINQCGCTYHLNCADGNVVNCQFHNNNFINFINPNPDPIIHNNQIPINNNQITNDYWNHYNWGYVNTFKCHICRTINHNKDNIIIQYNTDNSNDNSNSDNECNICLEKKNKFIKLKCTHQLCTECFHECNNINA